jgi:thymidylate kinase
MYSTFAYGGLNIDDVQWLKEMNKFFLVPDLVVLLHVPPVECIRRIHTTRTEVEMFEELDHLEKIWEEYQKLANENNNFVIIDADRSKKTVAEDVYREVKKILS